MRTGGLEPPQPEATGLQPAELADAQRPLEGWPAGIEPAPRDSQPRVLAATPRPPRSGDDRTRTGGLSADNRALFALSYAPMEFIARAGFEPAISSS